jgi:hypothetical protein
MSHPEWTPPGPAGGFLPLFLNTDNPAGAVDQINKSYAHGGGWHDFHGFDLIATKTGAYRLQYPQDPPMKEISRTTLRDEIVVLFTYDWVAVIQQDGSFRVARLD